MFVILNISDSDKHWWAAIDEYKKRLWKSVKIEDLKPTRNGTPKQIIEKDTENILELLEKKYQNYYRVLLTKEWKSLTTMELVTLSKQHIDMVFVVGWPYGFDEEKLQKAVNFKISFGAITLPHWLAKLTILEQIYRVQTIKEGKPYHY
jgi:23S rRNA (pseudouridine1915-N3)-methyltransferase